MSGQRKLVAYEVDGCIIAIFVDRFARGKRHIAQGGDDVTTRFGRRLVVKRCTHVAELDVSSGGNGQVIFVLHGSELDRLQDDVAGGMRNRSGSIGHR